MEPTDLTIEILKEIRDGVTQLSARVDGMHEGLSGRIDRLSSRVDDMNESLSSRIDETNRRIVGSEIRTATALTDLAGTVQEMTQVLRSQQDLRPRVERCERDIEELKRTGR